MTAILPICRLNMAFGKALRDTVSVMFDGVTGLLVGCAVVIYVSAMLFLNRRRRYRENHKTNLHSLVL
jgi:hypothetical protein